ncbi:MAG: DUF4158 domain-containing protein, partial [Flavobacteriales bacterium]|nr:DUF4158 domain-containing protein [Flavobacteriales bacterium]
MNILDKNSFEIFHKPPEFTSTQRKSCFTFSQKRIEDTKKLRSPTTQIGFLLSLGYFKVSKRFYDPEDFYTRDINHVAKLLGYNASDFISQNYLLRTRQRYNLRIIKLCGYKSFDSSVSKKIIENIDAMVRQYLKTNLIFWRCIDLMINDKICPPTYNKISKLILSRMSSYKSEMTHIINQTMSVQCRDLLNSLFLKTAESNKFELTLLKKPSHSTKPLKIKN